MNKTPTLTLEERKRLIAEHRANPEYAAMIRHVTERFKAVQS